MPSLSPRLASSTLHEASPEILSPFGTEKRAIQVGPATPSVVRYVAIYYDLFGNVRTLMPTRITQELLGLVSGGQVQSILEAVLLGFLRDPVLALLSNWQVRRTAAWYADHYQSQAQLASTPNAVVNMCIDINALPILRTYNTWLHPGGPDMRKLMPNLIQQSLFPYWAGSPSGGLVSLDPRGVSVEVLLVPLATEVASAAMSCVFNLATPPGSASRKTSTTTQGKLRWLRIIYLLALCQKKKRESRWLLHLLYCESETDTIECEGFTKGG